MSTGTPVSNRMACGAAPSRTQTLECLGIVAGPQGVVVHLKVSGEMVGLLCLPFEEALFRIEEFTEQSQGVIEAMLSVAYSIPGFRVMYATPFERKLIKNYRALDREMARAMWEMIDDLAEDDVLNSRVPSLTTTEPT